MAVREEMLGDVAILFVTGRLRGGRESQDVLDTVKRLLGEGVRKVVLDVSEVDLLNSLGLGMLIRCLTSLRNEDGDLKLVGVTESVHSLLMMTQLITVVETFETLDQAVSGFR